MKPRSNDDPLLDFLRQHRPLPPDPAPDLRERILQETTRHPHPRPRPAWTPPWVQPWAIPAMATVAIGLTWVGWRSWQPPSMDPVELAQLETFLEDNWNGALYLSATDTPTTPAADLSTWLLSLPVEIY